MYATSQLRAKNDDEAAVLLEQLESSPTSDEELKVLDTKRSTESPWYHALWTLIKVKRKEAGRCSVNERRHSFDRPGGPELCGCSTL